MRIHRVFDHAQNALSKAQPCCCVAGALTVSPIKAIVSIAQIIYSLAMLVISTVLGTLFCFPCCCGDSENDAWLSMMTDSLKGTAKGTVSLVYSVANFATLGITSQVVEGCRCCFRCCPISL